MNNLDDVSSKDNTSWSKTLLAVLPFVTFGLGSIFAELPHGWVLPAEYHDLSNYLFLITIAYVPIGFCVGWIKGFPRWSYPYVGMFLLISLYMVAQPAPGFMSGEDLLGWRSWIPLGIVAIISLLITRSLNPLKDFFTNISQDWTLLTFGMFGFLPLMTVVIYDEMDRLYSLIFMMILTAIMVGTVIAYMSGSDQKARVKVMVIGSFLTIAIAVAGPSWYWYDRMEANFWPTLIAGILLYIIMLLPALIGIFHRTTRISEIQLGGN